MKDAVKQSSSFAEGEFSIEYPQDFEEDDRDKDSRCNIYAQARKGQFVGDMPQYYVSIDRRLSFVSSQEQLVGRSTDILGEGEE